MSIASKISSAEINSQITSQYVDKHFEVALVNSPGTTYEPGTTNDTTFMASEVALGTAGYQRKVIKYENGDKAAYADKGMALARKAVIFQHDLSATTLTFSHIVILRGNGNILTLGTPTTTPSGAVNGTYTNLPTSTLDGGVGATLNLTVSSSGTVFALTPNSPGYLYSPGDVLTIQEASLVAAGVCSPGGGNLVVAVSTVTTGGSIYSVSKPNTTVNVTDGNQVVLYIDIKHYGFYN